MRKTTVRTIALLVAGFVALGIAFAHEPGAPRVSTVAMRAELRPEPVPVDPHGRYIVFLTSTGKPQFSKTEFGEAGRNGIAAALKERGFTVTTDVIGTDEARSTRKVTQLAERLLESGVPPDSITLVANTSSASALVSVAAQVARGRVGYVLVDGCAPQDLAFGSAVPLHGRFLSIISDPRPDGRPGVSCHEAFSGRGAGRDFTLEEVTLRPDPAGPSSAIPELMLVEAIASWARGPVVDEGM